MICSVTFVSGSGSKKYKEEDGTHKSSKESDDQTEKEKRRKEKEKEVLTEKCFYALCILMNRQTQNGILSHHLSCYRKQKGVKKEKRRCLRH